MGEMPLRNATQTAAEKKRDATTQITAFQADHNSNNQEKEEHNRPTGKAPLQENQTTKEATKAKNGANKIMWGTRAAKSDDNRDATGRSRTGHSRTTT